MREQPNPTKDAAALRSLWSRDNRIVYNVKRPTRRYHTAVEHGPRKGLT